MRGFPDRLRRVLFWSAAVPVAYLLLVRPLLLRWGATREEARAALPGDELMPRAHVVATRAVTIAAPPEAVWPWLAEVSGPDERLAPEPRKFGVGDLLPAGRGDAGFRVERAEPDRLLVLSIRGFYVTLSWTIALRDLGGGRTRLVSRQRVRCRPGVPGFVYLLLSQSADFLAVRGRLAAVKTLAEREFRRSFLEPRAGSRVP
ncbi:hypothetical protein Nocox_29270 [Nonomuraea coxensis DSM 45129]|uniref:SRPBCC family protein n=1 Tax=Nonomuraea coxensis DSM 45129 TaxID=1122611 RepID=A0ABX8U9M9_9ACTN|nr:hypothetical protein [Nonomuraea coxensis]QYC43438.1 hypothetical protein Nocox_29270 [Nonomuraea coxensis DSM 45129]